jgi:hypothetical protein
MTLERYPIQPEWITLQAVLEAGSPNVGMAMPVMAHADSARRLVGGVAVEPKHAELNGCAPLGRVNPPRGQNPNDLGCNQWRRDLLHEKC